MKFRVCFLISLLWIQINPTSAQIPPLDSLLNAASSQSGPERLVTQNLIVRYHDLPDGGSIVLCDTIFQVADRLGEYLEGVEAQLTKGHIYFEEREFELALITYKKIKNYIVSHKIEQQYHEAFGAIAGVFEAWNQPDSALYYAGFNIDYWAEHDSTELAFSLKRMSYYYSLYELPLKSYQTEQRLLEIGRARNDSSIIASAYSQIASLLGYQLDDNEAEKYYHKAIDYNTNQESQQELVIVLSNYGIFNKKRGRYEKADSLQRAALSEIDSTINNWNLAYFKSHIYHNLSALFRAQNMWDSTLYYGRKSLTFTETGYHTKVIASTSAEMVIAFSELGILDSAQIYHDRVFELIRRKINPKQYKVGLEGRAIFLEKKGDFKGAHQAYRQFSELDDSLKAIQQGHQLTFSMESFKMKERDLAIDRLTLEKQSADNLRNLLLVLFLSFITVSIVWIYTYYFRAKKNKQLLLKTQEIEQLKSKFFANISHELRTPLTLILGPTETLLSKASAEDKGLLMLIKTHSLRLKKLVNQVLELTKIEAGKMKLKVREENILPYLKGWVYSFKSQAETKSVILQVSSPEQSLSFYFQKDYLEHIVNNLVHNAIKFSSEGSTVRVTALRSKDQQEIIITVTDRGIGIPSEALPFIFDRFYQVENPNNPFYEGTGIGLSLTKELVELHGGTIEVSSTPGFGTKFTLTFSAGFEHFSKDQIREPLPYSQQIDLGSEEISPDGFIVSEKDQRALVLIVEDQEEVRSYLKSELSATFQIITAENGQQGLEIARNRVPDLILSDMMMPVMDGLELANILKNDPITDHIPMIMLTARGETEDILEALESKVDSYLTKPFNPSELTLRISNLIQLKKNIGKQYSSNGHQIVEESGYSPKEAQFLATIEAVLEEHLANEQLDVNLLADAMNLSRSQLFRKLRSISGESPSSYIRDFRLEKAKLLLQNEYLTVAEVSFLVGFNSPSYFSKCFSDKFGKSPGKLIRSRTE